MRFVITTHSPFIINSALEFENQNVYHLQNGVCLNPKGYNKELKERNTILSLHQNLGMLPSDLFFSNCLIWVEGPTDGIYLNFWLEKYIEENDLKILKKGLDYEFALLGGATAENFYLLPDDYEFDYSNNPKIFDMLKIHPKSFVVVDNDKGELLTNLSIKGKSNFEEFKIRLIEQDESRGSFWYDQNPNNFTIECYRNDFTVKLLGSGKKAKALKYCNKNINKKFSEITKSYCSAMIAKIYKKIVE